MIINTHICRGNYNSAFFCSGPCDTVADYVFAKENVNALFLEYDDARSGGFAPLAKVSPDKKVVLGLITTKTPQLEDKETVIARIHEAAKYVPLDRLYLSPQCGFASCEIGNKLTEEEQWAKLKLLKEIAEEVKRHISVRLCLFAFLYLKGRLHNTLRPGSACIRENAKKTLQKLLTSKLGMFIMMTIKLGKSQRIITQGGFTMNREEILAMNRKESEGREDERELKIFADASKFGMAVGGILSVLIVLFSRIVELPVLGFAAWAVYFAMFGSRRAYQYCKTKESGRLVQALIGIVAGTACIAGMIVMGLQK